MAIPSVSIKDECIDHHYDVDTLPWNVINNSFGANYNDIPIHSELLRKELKETNNHNEDHTKHKANANFITEFISYMLTSQCPRYDLNIFDAMQQDDGTHSVDTFEADIRSWLKHVLFTDIENDPKCVQQLIIYQYAPKNRHDSTDINGYQLVKLKNNTKKATIWNAMNPLNNVTKLLQHCKNHTFEETKVDSDRLPLFVHHFIPKYAVSSKDLTNALHEEYYGILLPQSIIATIVEFAVIMNNEIYYNSWYLQRNAKQSSNGLVKLWDELLFNKKCYALTDNNPYNGHIENIWVPSVYLLENKNDSMKKIIDELRQNNVLHIYRQIIWAIILSVNPLNQIFNHDTNHIVGSSIYSNKGSWLEGYNLSVLYIDVLKWEEWKAQSLHSNTKDLFVLLMMYVFNGNIWNSIYGVNRLLLISEYDINAGMMYPQNIRWNQNLEKRMDEIYPLLPIANTYKLIKTLIETFTADNDEFESFPIYLLFDPSSFNPLLKCYLVELMFMDGMDALVLTFAAYIALASNDVISVYKEFVENGSNDVNDTIVKVTRELYSFDDVKGIAKLYNEYRNQLMEEHGDKIKLKCNPLVMAIDNRQPPPSPDLL